MTGGPPPRRMPKPGRKAAAPVAVVEEIVEEVEEVEEAEAPSPVEGSPRSLAEVGRQDTPAAGALMNLLTPSPREGKPMDKCARTSTRLHTFFILRVPLRLIRSEVSEGDGGEGAAAEGADSLALELPGDADAEAEPSP